MAVSYRLAIITGSQASEPWLSTFNAAILDQGLPPGQMNLISGLDQALSILDEATQKRAPFGLALALGFTETDGDPAELLGALDNDLQIITFGSGPKPFAQPGNPNHHYLPLETGPGEAARLIPILGAKWRAEVDLKHIHRAELISSTNNIVVRLDSGGRVIFVNEFAEKHLGWPGDQLLGHHILESFWPATDSSGRDQRPAAQRIIADPETSVYEECEVITFAGQFRWVAWTTTPIRDASGRLMEIVIIGTDVSELKKTRDELQEWGSRLQAILEATADGIVVIDNNGGVVNTNKRFVKMWGLNEETIASGERYPVRQHMLSQIKNTDAVLQRMNEIYAEPELDSREQIYLTDGRVFERFTIPQRLDGRIIGRVWSFRDITEHRRTKESLRKSEIRFEMFMDHQTALAFLKDEQGHYLYINQACLEFYGHTPAERLGKTDDELWPLNVAAQIKANDRRVLAANRPAEFTEMVEVDGRERIHLTHKFPLDLGHGEKALGGLALDITDRVEAELALAEEKERLGITLNSIAEGVITVDATGLIESINPVAESLSGWSAARATARTLSEVLRLSPEDPRQPSRRLASLMSDHCLDRRLSTECILTDRHGRQRVVTITASPISGGGGGTVIVFRDITLQRRREEETFKAAKLESVGQLAGGLAHDFNNLLSAILGNISLARMDTRNQISLDDTLAAAEASCLRARDLTRQLLTFARGGSPVREITDLAQMIGQTASFALRGSASKCQLNLDNNLKPARVDAGQLGQAITNIVINADQAMPTGGLVRVSARNSIDRKGEWVVITIEDQGPGLNPNFITRLFDPYFSTKEAGDGLGLAVAHSVVSQHGGELTAANRPQGGARFTIRLPAGTSAEPSPIPAKRPEPFSGQRRVLIMDDEPMIRDVVSAMLARLGYEATTTPDGARALEAYSQAQAMHRPFDAVIMDLTIPGGLGGKEAIAELLKLDPQARVVVSSGYSQDPIMAAPRDYGFIDVAAKPFRLNELAKLMDRIFKDRP